MLRAEPEARFVFGDNVLRRGRGGQAAEMRGEPNAIGVVTKWNPVMREASFFRDHDPDIAEGVERDLRLIWRALKDGRVVYFPTSGIGTGLADLPARAPILHARIEKYIKALAEEFPP
jgi:hypothetical protein